MNKYIFSWLFVPSIAFAESSGRQTTFVGQVVFWIGAAAVMYLVGRVVFKEQLHERRTLRRLMDEIGPFHREFDITSITRWVHRCNPHVWHLYIGHDFSDIEDFVTPEFKEIYREQGPRRVTAKGEKLRLDKVLKVHPLGVYMTQDVKPPLGVELMLRLEEKVEIMPSVSTGEAKEAKFTQVQTFWVLRHDGKGWRLNRVWEATEDVTDLAQRTPVPPVTEWMPRSST